MKIEKSKSEENSNDSNNNLNNLLSFTNSSNSSNNSNNLISNENNENNNNIKKNSKNEITEKSVYLTGDIQKQINNTEKEELKEKIKILIVDDNTIINESIKKLVDITLNGEKINYEILMLNDGLDILRILLTEKNNNNIVDYIFTDENMDYLNGSEAIALVRLWEKMNKTKRSYITSITCHEDPKIVNNILSKGADQVLTKPMTKSLVKTTFKKTGLIK